MSKHTMEAGPRHARPEEEDFSAWEEEQQEARVEADRTNPEVSPFAARVTRAAERVVGALEGRAKAKAETEAYQINAAVDQKNATYSQAEAFASYDENIEATASREQIEADDLADMQAGREEGEAEHTEALSMNREFDANADVEAGREFISEKMDNAEQTVKGWGRAALGAARITGRGLATVGLAVVAVGTNVVNGVGNAARKAQVRAAERAAYREEDSRNAESQDEAYDSYAENIDATQTRETEEATANEAQAEQERIAQIEAEATAKARIDQMLADRAAEKAREAANLDMLNEAHDMNESFDLDVEARRDAIAQAAAASERKEARQKARREKMILAGDVTSEIYKSAKGSVKRFGRAAMRFMKRGAKMAGGAVKGAVQGAKASMNETAS